MATQTQNTDTMPGTTSIAETFAGKIPSNDDLLSQLSNLRKVLKEQREGNKELDEKGKQIALALERFAWNTEHMIQEKNWDGAVQKFAERVIHFADRVKKESDMRHGDVKDALGRLTQSSDNLRRLFSSLFTSADTRRLLLDGTGMVGAVLTLTAQEENDQKQGKMTDMSDDMKREISARYRNILAEVGRKQEFKEVRQDVMDMFDFWSGVRNKASTTSTSTATTDVALNADDREEQKLIRELTTELRILFDEAISIMQRFAQGHDLRRLEDRFWALYNDINNDPEASSFFKDLRHWSDAIVSNPDSSESPEVVEQGKKLIDRAIFVRRKYGRRISELTDEAKEVLNSLQKERYLSAYKEDLQQIKDLTTNGSFIDTISQFQHLALPVIREMMQQIKFQPIEINESWGHLKLDNLLLKTKEVDLDDIYVQFKFGMKDMMRAEVVIRNIDATFQGIKFWYERTTMPQISDSGTLNCRVTSRDWKMKMVVRNERGKTPYFELSEVRGGMRRFKIDIVESNHKLLGSLVMPVINATLRKRAQDSIEAALKENGEFIANKMNELFSTSPFSTQTFSPFSLFSLSSDSAQPHESSVSAK